MPTLALYWSLMGAALLSGAALSLATGGRQDIGFYQVLGAIFSQLDEQSLAVLRDIRVPRTLIAALIGANLSLAGLLLQATTRNPLSSPSILGINQGAALGIAIGLVFPSLMIFNVDTMAVLGAAFAGGVTLTLAGGFKGTLSALRLILSGVAVSAFAFALVRFTFTLDDELARSIIQWTTGDISDVRWKQATPLLLWCVSGSVITFFMSHKLNLMALGEAASKGLGSDPRFTLLFWHFAGCNLDRCFCCSCRASHICWSYHSAYVPRGLWNRPPRSCACRYCWRGFAYADGRWCFQAHQLSRGDRCWRCLCLDWRALFSVSHDHRQGD